MRRPLIHRNAPSLEPLAKGLIRMGASQTSRLFKPAEQFAGKIISGEAGKDTPSIAATVVGGVRKGKLVQKLRQRAGLSALNAARNNGQLDRLIQDSVPVGTKVHFLEPGYTLPSNVGYVPRSIAEHVRLEDYFEPGSAQRGIRRASADAKAKFYAHGVTQFDAIKRRVPIIAAAGLTGGAVARVLKVLTQKQREQRREAARARWSARGRAHTVAKGMNTALEPLAKDAALTDDANTSSGLGATPAAPSFSGVGAPTGTSPHGYWSNYGPGAKANIDAVHGIEPSLPPSV